MKAGVPLKSSMSKGLNFSVRPWVLVARRRLRVAGPVKCKWVSQPKSIFKATQTIVSRAIDRPAPKHVSSVGCTNPNTSNAIFGKFVVHENDFGAWVLRMGRQLKFYGAAPLDITFCRLIPVHNAVFKHLGLFHPRQNEVTELLMSTVKRSHVPADADVDESQRNQLKVRAPTLNERIAELHCFSTVFPAWRDACTLPARVIGLPSVLQNADGLACGRGSPVQLCSRVMHSTKL